MLNDGRERFLLALVPCPAPVDELETVGGATPPVARPCALSTWSAADSVQTALYGVRGALPVS